MGGRWCLQKSSRADGEKREQRVGDLDGLYEDMERVQRKYVLEAGLATVQMGGHSPCPWGVNACVPASRTLVMLRRAFFFLRIHIVVTEYTVETDCLGFVSFCPS